MGEINKKELSDQKKVVEAIANYNKKSYEEWLYGISSKYINDNILVMAQVMKEQTNKNL